VKILFVCHRFPFPPKRGGKIRPFNTIKHLAASHEVTVASLARSHEEALEGAGIAPYCAGYEMAEVRNPIQVARMLLRLPTPVPSSMGFFYSAALARRVRERIARERFDLIIVHCSSVAQYVDGVRDIPKILDFGDMDSQKWLEYARYKPFPLSAGYWFEGKKLEREERRLAGRFDLCTATTRAEWETLEAYRTGVATDWFPNGVDSTYFSPAAASYSPTPSASSAGWTTIPIRNACSISASARYPVRARRNIKLLIVGADPTPAVKSSASRCHGHRIGGRRASYLPIRAHGRSSQHRQGHPEQDPRGHGVGSARRHEPCRGGRGRRRTGRAFPGRERSWRIRAGRAADSRQPGAAPAAEHRWARSNAF
jgi:sugar transferase (PEP-CTERM/EpsH1 system associated)